jgi:deoxyribonuclease-4
MQLGAHESISGGIFRAIERGRDATCDVIQVFNKSSNQWRAKELTDDDVRRLQAAQDETGVSAVCSHASYLINIASPEPGLCQKSVQALAIEMRRCNQLGIPNLVLHPGSHVGSGEEQGLRQVAASLDEVFSDLDANEVTLCLENTAGQGSNLGYSFAHLSTIMEACSGGKLGICLDTCHLFAAGYPLAAVADFDRAVRDLDETVGLATVRVIHLNDSKHECGSRKDRHEHIGQGEIGLDGFRHLLNDERFTAIPMVLETPKEGDGIEEDRENLATLRALIASP